MEQRMDRETQLVDIVVRSDSPMSLGELTEASAFPKTTVYRILQKLCRNGLLMRNNKYYIPGTTLIRWMSVLHKHGEYFDIIHRHLLALAHQTGHTIHLVQREGNHAYYIDKIDSKGAISLKSKIGDRLELYSTAAGRAILALFSEEEFQNYLSETSIKKLTPRTLTDTDAIREAINKAGRCGYAMEIEQNEVNVQCIGAAFEYNKRQLAISITLTTLNTREELVSFHRALLDEMRKIKAVLGA